MTAAAERLNTLRRLNTIRFDNDENAMVDHIVAAEDYARECMSTAAFGGPDRADSTLMGLIETHIGISWNTSLIWELRVTSADTVVVLCTFLCSQLLNEPRE